MSRVRDENEQFGCLQFPNPPQRNRTSGVIYRGRTWAVTNYGAEKLTGVAYYIPRSSAVAPTGPYLFNTGNSDYSGGKGKDVFTFLPHIASKGWEYDFADFARCFTVALKAFGVKADPERIRRSLVCAFAIHRHDIGNDCRDIWRFDPDRPRKGYILVGDIRDDELCDWSAGWDRPDLHSR